MFGTGKLKTWKLTVKKLRYVEDVDANSEDVMLERKQFVPKCYGKNQLSSSENRYKKWKEKTVAYRVQKI